LNLNVNTKVNITPLVMPHPGFDVDLQRVL